MDWWRLNAKKCGKIIIRWEIEWTCSREGYVRARHNEKEEWKYQKCGCAKNAESIGLSLLEKDDWRHQKYGCIKNAESVELSFLEI